MGDRDVEEILAPTFDYQPPQDARVPWHQGEFKMVGKNPWRGNLPVRVVVRDRDGRLVGSRLLPSPADVSERDPAYRSSLASVLEQIADDVEREGEVVQPGVVLHVPRGEAR